MITLQNQLNQIKKVFDIDKVLNTKITKAYISRHYNLNKLTYTLFQHSEFIHFSITRKGQFSEEDYLEAPNMVAAYIKKLKAKKVLELGTGRGGNSAYLAPKFPEVAFKGIDLSSGQLSYAYEKAKILTNFHPQLGDFHHLEQFDDETFDIAFVVESLCHSSEKAQVFKEVRRVLKKGGVFIVFDGYAKRKTSDLSKEEVIAKQLVERGWALEGLDYYPDFAKTGEKAGFKIVHEEDATPYVFYTVNKFERLAVRFFRHPKLAKILSTIVPYEVTYNAITGLLLPTMIESGIHGYFITVFQKN